MTFFITALPIACIISMFVCLTRVQADGWVLLTLTQRPIPTGAVDIGMWQDIFYIMSVIAVSTSL